MDTGWIASLSIATSINTVGADVDVYSASDSEYGSGSIVGSYPFPRPPPRSRASSLSTATGQIRTHPSHHVQQFSDGSSSSADVSSDYLPLSSKHYGRETSFRPAYKQHQRYSESDDGHTYGSVDSAQEPLEQLKRSRDEAYPDGSDPETGAAFPKWRTRTNTLTSSSGRLPRPARRGSIPWQRPQIPSGLPTSYDHNRPRTWSHVVSVSSQTSSSSSQPSLGESTSTQTISADGAEAKAKSPSTPVLSPSPALHFSDHDRSWSQLRSDYARASLSSTTVASLHTRTRGNSLRGRPSSSGHSNSHSRNPSLPSTVFTRPSSPETSFEPLHSIIPDDAVKSTRLVTLHSGDNRSLSMVGPYQSVKSDRRSSLRLRSNCLPFSQSQPDLSILPSTAAQRAAWDRPSAVRHHGSHVRFPTAANTAQVTTELVSSPSYFEPHNRCEAIVLPRPRLRSRSLGTGPSIVVERVHVTPERLWQRNIEGNSASMVQAAPRSRVVRAADRIGVPHQSLGQAEPSTTRDPRLLLHKDVAPPLPPKDSPGPSPALLSSKPLPPLPVSHTSSAALASRNSFDSVENLDAQELLLRNQQLEQDRRAWREESRTSLVADLNAFRERFSPCLRDPSPLPRMGRRTEAPLSARPHEAGPSPIRVHRVWNKDGTEHTFLVVHSRRGHLYGNQRMSVSSPDLRDGQSAGMGRITSVKHFAQRLGNLATSRCSRPSETRQERAPPTPQHDAHKSPQPTPGSARLFGKDRKLVTDETVVIGRPLESANEADLPAATALSKDGSPAISQEAESVEQATIHTARHESLTKSRYRPAGTRDEIKAQLGETPRVSISRRLSLSSRSPGEEHEGEVKWIDPGSNTVMQGKLILPDSHRARQQPLAEGMDPDRRDQLVPSPFSERTSGSGSYLSFQTDDQRDPVSASPWGNTVVEQPSTISSTAQMAEDDLTRASSFSTETDNNFVLWDASNVDLDDLFFRPPQ